MIIYNVRMYDYLPLLGLEDDIDADIDFLVFSQRIFFTEKQIGPTICVSNL